MNYDFVPGSGNNYNTGTDTPNTNIPNFPYQPVQLADFKQPNYAEDVLNSGRELYAQFYMSYPDSNEWRDSIFSGYIEESGKDFVVVRSPSDNKWYLLWTVYLNYAVFTEDPMTSVPSETQTNRKNSKFQNR